MIIHYTVPEIWYMTNVIVIFILGYTFRFYHSPSTSLKNKNFKTMKKGLEISFYTSALKNYDHMLYYSWYMVCDGCNCYFSFWAVFALLPPNNPKNDNFKTMKKTPGYISSFYTHAPKIMIICYIVSEIWCVRDVIVIFQFVLFFALSPS